MNDVATGLRVSCHQCKQHRDIRRFAICPNCGTAGYAYVRPTPGDVAAIEHDVIATAEAVDRALYTSSTLEAGSAEAYGLRQACRALALARAGKLASPIAPDR